MTNPREEALELAERWRAEGFGVWWTDSKEGDGAKRCTSSWNTKAVRCAEMEVGALAGSIANRLPRKNPVLVAKASNLILIDCDSVEDVAAFKSHGPPPTLSVATSAGRHFYYRPDDGDPPGGIYFENGAVTPKTDCYVVMPPAVHPSGRVYAYENENAINVLPSAVRKSMLNAAGAGDDELAERMADDPSAKVIHPGRHPFLVRELGKLRNTRLGAAAILAAMLDLNDSRCDPPVPKRDIERMVKDAMTKWKSNVDFQSWSEDELRRHKATMPEGPTITDMDDVDMKSVVWLDRPWLQGAAFQLVAAKGSTGKGLWTAKTAAQVTTGAFGDKRNVLFITSEDDPGIDLKPRLAAAGADMSPGRIGVLQMGFWLPEHTTWLQATIRERELGMVVIDPVSNHIAGADSNDESAVRHALAQLNVVAQTEECLILGVRHMRKDAAGAGALSAVLGSTAWVDLPRNVIVMVRDPEDKTIVHQSVEKQNRAEMTDEGRVYRISGVEVDGVEGSIGKMELALDVEYKVLDTIVGKRKDSATASARAVIIGILEEHNGEMVSDELDAAVVARTGLAAKTIRNARSAMTVEYKRQATREKPLQKVPPPQMGDDKAWRVKLGYVEMREGEDGEAEEF